MISEFAPTKRRATLLAAVFSCQALGYATANIVALIVTVIVQNQQPAPTPRSIDQIWRWVVGLSLIPAFLASVLRLTIPESPRYTLDVNDNIAKAFDESNRFNNANLEPEWVRQANRDIVSDSINSDNTFDPSKPKMVAEIFTTEEASVLDIDQSQIQAHKYFIIDGNWRILLGTSLAWFLLDIGKSDRLNA